MRAQDSRARADAVVRQLLEQRHQAQVLGCERDACLKFNRGRRVERKLRVLQARVSR